MPVTPFPKSLSASLFVVALGVSATPAWSQAKAAVTLSEPNLAYTVAAKDTLMAINKKWLKNPSDWSEVAKLNGLRNANVISPGQVLQFPLRLIKAQPQGAKVLSTSGDVSVATGASVAEGGQIRVGANSSAVIELADKSKVKLLPGTLAEVLQNRNYAMRDSGSSISTNWFSGAVRLVQGSVEVLAEKTGKRATPLQVILPTAVVGVRGTVFRAAHEGGNSRTEVLEGRVRADNPAQQSGGDVASGFGAVVDPKVREITAVALLPAPDFSTAAAQLNRPQATWSFASVAGAVAYRIQVASDADFNTVVRDIQSTKPQADLSSLNDGQWHVRARGVDGIGLEGFNAARIVALNAAKPAPAPVALMQPITVSRASVRLVDGRITMQLPAVDADHAQITGVMASDAGLKQVISTQTVRAGTDWPLGQLRPGTYFFQFRGQDKLGRDNASPVYKLSLNENWGVTVFNLNGALELVQP